MRSAYLWGPLSRFGVIVAVLACAIDQASKLYLLRVVDLARTGPIRLGPFFDFVLTRNTGISYGWFQTTGPLGAWVLLAVKIVAVVLLWIWLVRASDRLTMGSARKASRMRGAASRSSIVSNRGTIGRDRSLSRGWPPSTERDHCHSQSTVSMGVFSGLPRNPWPN